MEYFRYMDDIIILAKTKRQFKRAKKILYRVLDKLELKLSPSKTKMGRLDNSFHFLGVLFEVTRIPQTKTMVSVRIHPRTCLRALDRLKAMQKDAVHPAIMQRYLIRWASWWSHTIESMRIFSLLLTWVHYTAGRDPTAVWLGRGLLPKQLLTI
jgi:RNA-directed DNA polymerase